MKEGEKNKLKANSRMLINNSLLGVCFALFTFIIAINPDLLKSNIFLASQLTLAIPFFLTSSFARSKLAYTKKPVKWDRYGFICFILAYTFLINVVGILLSTLVSLGIGLTFFGVCILSDLVYSYMDLSEKKDRIKSQIYKDIMFILIILVGGILPSLGVF
jgi:hypothetical protein